MGAVLLRLAGQDPLVLNAEAHPPHIELGEPVNAGGGEGDAIVGPDRPRETVLTEQPVEDRPHAQALGGQQALARHQEARVLIGDGERLAVEAVLRSEVPFEVRGPEVVGVQGRGGHHAGMLARAAPPSLLDQAVARHEIAGRAGRR